MRLPLGIHKDVSIEDYHSQQGQEEHFYSSSQLKNMLKDPEVFHKEYILGQKENVSNPNFDVGHYFHTAILEPHLLEAEFAFFDGKIRRGKAWDSFLETNKGKICLTASNLSDGKKIVKAVEESPIAQQVLEGTTPEVSCMTKVYVDISSSTVFAKDFKGNWKYLTITGWEDAEEIDDFGLIEIKLKVRSDSLKEGEYIADLKSSSKNVKNEHDMKSATASYAYDMSAALYLDMFNLWYEKSMDTFIWIYASKATGSSKTWYSTPEILQIGRAKWKKAVVELAICIADDWAFDDVAGKLVPFSYEKDWITNF